MLCYRQSTFTMRKKNIDRVKKLNKKKIVMKNNPETEKIIKDAEKSFKDKDTYVIDIKSKMEKVNAEKELILKNMKLQNEKKSKNNVTRSSKSDILILDNEFIEDKNNEPVENNLEELEEENNLKDLESNFIYVNEKLKSENIKLEEKIKDQTGLLDKFLSQQRYSDLDKKIRLYQEDNAILRKKIFELSNKEAALRLKLSNQNLDQQIKVQNNEKQNIKELNIKIEELTRKINQMGNELLELRNNSESQPVGIDQKIKFYREEYAKIIVAKSDIEKKLENTKIQLATNENNKRELRAALSNLNRILDSSNVESSTFVNKTEKQETATNPIDIDKIKEE